MSLTKTNYELIASVIKSSKPAQLSDDDPNSYNGGWKTGAGYEWFQIASNLGDAFGLDNPKFDRRRFLESCGINDG